MFHSFPADFAHRQHAATGCDSPKRFSCVLGREGRRTGGVYSDLLTGWMLFAPLDSPAS